MVRLMFGEFEVPAMYITTPAVLALYAYQGRTSGIAVDCGHSLSSAVPVVEGHIVPHAVLQVNIGGQDLTKYFVKLREEQGASEEEGVSRFLVENHIGMWESKLDEEGLRELKEGSGRREFEVELPNGGHTQLRWERFACAELLFKPALVGKEDDGLAEMTHKSIQKCDGDIKNTLYTNIVLCGGMSGMSGLAHRLQTGVKQIAPAMQHVHVPNSNACGEDCVWHGGAALASCIRGKELFLGFSYYDEKGPMLVEEWVW